MPYSQSDRKCDPHRSPNERKQQHARNRSLFNAVLQLLKRFCDLQRLWKVTPSNLNHHCNRSQRIAAAAMDQSTHVLEFRDICYDVVLKSGKDAGSTKRILQEVSAQCVSGRFTALMGPSGAGKSSLVGFRERRTTTHRFCEPPRMMCNPTHTSSEGNNDHTFQICC